MTWPDSGPLLDSVRSFAFPRFPGGQGERRAADLVAERLTDAGLAVVREPFRASPSAVRRLRLLIHGVLAALVLLLGFVAPQSADAGLFFGVAFLLLVGGATRWTPLLESAFDTGRQIASRNVVARRPGTGESPLRIVVLAHIDSKSARFPTFWPSLLIIVSVAIALGLTLGTLLLLTRGWPPPPATVFVPLGVIAAGALLVSPFNPAGDESPGAMDNASGLAVLVDAACRLPRDPALNGCELVFLATGAEEIGLAGAMRWIQAHERELDRGRTVFVNVDSVGVGSGLITLGAKGRAPGGRAMKDVVKDAAKAAGVVVRNLGSLPGVGVDTIPIASRGFATVTVLGQVLGSASRRIHSSRDTVEHLTESALTDASVLVAEIAKTVALSAPR